MDNTYNIILNSILEKEDKKYLLDLLPSLNTTQRTHIRRVLIISKRQMEKLKKELKQSLWSALTAQEKDLTFQNHDVHTAKSGV